MQTLSPSNIESLELRETKVIIDSLNYRIGYLKQKLLNATVGEFFSINYYEKRIATLEFKKEEESRKYYKLMFNQAA